MPSKPAQRAKRKARAVRALVTIDPRGDWMSCTEEIPRDCEVFGTIVIGSDLPGVLARLGATRTYVRVLDGDIKVLIQSQVRPWRRAGVVRRRSRWCRLRSGAVADRELAEP